MQSCRFRLGHTQRPEREESSSVLTGDLQQRQEAERVHVCMGMYVCTHTRPLLGPSA